MSDMAHEKAAPVLEWELLTSDHTGYVYRARVFGGWLVRDVQDVIKREPFDTHRTGPTTGNEWTSSICFVPDPHGNWSR